jgi:ribosomal protein L7Ae-like RNA K-turn-binding protein
MPPGDGDRHADSARQQGQAGERLLNLLGLARRAGRLAVGATAVERMVAQGRHPVVIVARDAGRSQRERARRLTPVRLVLDEVVGREDLARALGRQELAIVALDDPGFVGGIERLGLVPGRAGG